MLESDDKTGLHTTHEAGNRNNKSKRADNGPLLMLLSDFDPMYNIRDIVYLFVVIALDPRY